MKPRPWRQRCISEEITTAAGLRECLTPPLSLKGRTIQGLDLEPFLADLADQDLEDTIFLGCQFGGRAQEVKLIEGGAAIFPLINNLPYDPYRSTLYTVPELMEGRDQGGYPGTRDFKIYEHFDRARRRETGVGLRETLAQRLHDHAIDDALEELLAVASGKGVVAIMGGHGTGRSDPYFRAVTHLTWALTRAGYFVATGGGPGIMEAGNLGAYFANYSDAQVLDDVLVELSTADKFAGGEKEGTPAYLEAIKRYFEVGQTVLERFSGEVDPALAVKYGRERPEPGQSLAIPTWFYGHEPSNLWSTHVAKYFSNSLREDGLLAIATGGVVFAPGSAGTMQEVFMDLAQNHYATFRFRSPMVFLGRERWTSLFALVHEFVKARGGETLYGDLIGLVDTAEEAFAFLEAHPPRLRDPKTPLYDLLEQQG
jgi:predicted Rossmann-fold nucleotide-binding protein